jgi:hypothetical protein
MTQEGPREEGRKRERRKEWNEAEKRRWRALEEKKMKEGKERRKERRGGGGERDLESIYLVMMLCYEFILL